MPLRASLLLLLLACGTVGCGDNIGPPAAWQPPILTSLLVMPGSYSLLEGQQVQLEAAPLDHRGDRMDRVTTITYTSTDTSVVTVDALGLVSSARAGNATIRLVAKSGTVSRQAEVTVRVLPFGSVGEVLIMSGPEGWRPKSVEVAHGTVVTWTAESLNWAGVPHRWLWLMRRDGQVMDSLDLSRGAASHRAGMRDTLLFCSGTCWDPPDFGVLITR